MFTPFKSTLYAVACGIGTTVATCLKSFLARLVPALLVALTFSAPVQAQTADNLRGGWISDEGDIRHVLILVIQDSGVTGSYCSTDCTSPSNLAFVDDGVLDDDRIHFTLYHDTGNGNVVTNRVAGTLVNDTLQLDIEQADAPSRTLAFIRSPRDTRAAAPPGGFGPPPPEYIPPAEPELITADNLAGLWLFGTGPNKQHFMFKQHRNGFRGMVCGPCLDAASMAPIENIVVDGTTLHFDIVHENSGPGILEYGPHSNVTVASISKNELHFATRPSFAGNDYALIHMTLLGPVAD